MSQIEISAPVITNEAGAQSSLSFTISSVTTRGGFGRIGRIWPANRLLSNNLSGGSASTFSGGGGYTYIT